MLTPSIIRSLHWEYDVILGEYSPNASTSDRIMQTRVQQVREGAHNVPGAVIESRRLAS